jgi:glyoxylase-like metal-dependent hydrolase (beta-lactamase superfamily II)
VIDLGDRVFEVLHLPGHSPGSTGLREKATNTLFSSIAIFDGRLIDDPEHSNFAEYEHRLTRLGQLPVEVVHAGHDPSFGRERLHQAIDHQFRIWNGDGQPA